MIDLKIKYFPNGDIEKLKARLLANGSLEWITDEDLYSPTASKETLLFIIALAVFLGLPLHEMDIVGAFLYSTLSIPVYCRLPSEFKDQHGHSIYWLLLKSLYGMRRAPRNFYDHLIAILKAAGYICAPFDNCVFYKLFNGELFVLVMWVDNIYYFSTTSQLSADFERIMADNFQITKSDEASNILGMVCQSNDDSSKTLLMPRIQEKLFEECFADETFTTSLTPMSPTFHETYANEAEQLTPTETTRQRRLLGLILQLVPIRPDLSFPHSLLATRVLRATTRDYEALKRIVRYIAFTIPLGLTLHTSPSPTAMSTPITLALYSDYSHNAHPDSKGHYGVAASLGDQSGVFYSKGGKVKVITDSTTAGEIYAGVKICKTHDWLLSVVHTLTLSLQQKAPLHLDNKSMIAVCTKITGATKRLRHILLHINFILERVQRDQIDLIHLPTQEMIVDMMTKALPPTTHWQHLPHLLGSSDAMTEKLAQAQRIINGVEQLPTYRRRGAPNNQQTSTTPTDRPTSVPTTESFARKARSS